MQQIPQPSPVYFQRPPKSRSTALLLEILPGLFGVYGIGWIYANKVGPGVALLIGGLVWDGIAIIVGALTGTISAICTLPVNIIAVVTSSIMISNYTKNHPEIFG
jgi:hypothetical protein